MKNRIRNKMKNQRLNMKNDEYYCKIGYNLKIEERYHATNKCIKARRI